MIPDRMRDHKPTLPVETTLSHLKSAAYWKRLIACASLAVALGFLVWSLINYQPATNFYGPRAIYSLIVLSLFLSLLGRVLLLRLLTKEMTESTRTQQQAVWKPLLLLDITAPIYLAAAVLIGIPAAVLSALLTQALLQGYTMLRGFVSWAEACYRVGSSALSAFLSGAVYILIVGSHHNDFSVGPPLYHLAESQELIGSIAAALVMMVLISLFALPILVVDNHVDLRVAWKQYLRSPVLRFQMLVLTVGPLLPVVDIFDDLAAELAWLFFLVPLFAIYYLALISTRLTLRTSELQQSLQDLSSARRRQGELQDYASLITRVQEEERRRLARELHDDTAQALIALSLGLESMERSMNKHKLPEKDIQWVSSLQNLADSTLEGVRRACRDLRPSILDDLGLRAAIEWLSDSSAARGVPCSFTCTGSPIPVTTRPEAEIAIFRIVQEALSNVWRHSGATQASIHLHYMPDSLHISVSDNGHGFDPAQIQLDVAHPEPGESEQSGLGLLGMRERASLIGANLSIVSSPGNGCTVSLSLPL
jgi:signal transduction histidine kinase